eukprot:9472964-Pyramimonas_sp.AAC.1
MSRRVIRSPVVALHSPSACSTETHDEADDVPPFRGAPRFLAVDLTPWRDAEDAEDDDGASADGDDADCLATRWWQCHLFE